MSPLRTALIVEQVASALDAAHADGLVHRDVKPSNVLITQIPSTAGPDFVYLVDFGICRTLKRLRNTSITEAGALIGTPEYMAPERFGDGSIDQQADVYALACMVYECLTAQLPFPAENLPALIYAHVNTPPPRPSTVRPEIPEGVDAVVAVGMAKDPSVRYSSAGELASALRTALLPDTVVEQPATASPPTQPAPVPPPAPESDPVAASSQDAERSPPMATPTRSFLPAPLAPYQERLGTHRWVVGLAVAVLVILVAVTGTILGTVLQIPGGGSSATARQSPPAVQTPETTAPTVDGTINVGSKPEAVALTPDGKNAYVTNVDSRNLSVINTATNKITTTIPVEAGPPQYIAITPDGKHAYATIYDPRSGVHSVAVIDTTANKVMAIIPVGRRPYGLAVMPDGSEVYEADHDSGAISVIDTTSNRVVETIGVMPNPHWIAFSPHGRTAYVADHESNVMSVIDTASRTVTSVIPTGKSPHSVAVSPDGGQVDVVDYDANTVTMIDTSRRIVTATVPVGANPRWVAYSPDGRFAYIANEGSGTMPLS
jgi:serine/threonine-protein kinase